MAAVVLSLAAAAEAAAAAATTSSSGGLTQTDPSWEEQLYWGTYRSNLYFGTRARSPSSPLTGLMWFDPLQPRLEVRHSCEQGDGMRRYGWRRHNGTHFGEQEIEDPRCGVSLRTSFMKYKPGKHGGAWSVRISGEKLSPSAPAGQEQPNLVSVLYYFTVPEGGSLSLPGKQAKKMGISRRDVHVQGFTQELGSFSFLFKEDEKNEYAEPPAHLPKVKGSPNLDRIHFVGVRWDDKDGGEQIWRVKEDVVQPLLNQARSNLFLQHLKARANSGGDAAWAAPANAPWLIPTLPNTIEEGSNVFVIQRIFTLPFEFDLVFLSHESGESYDSATAKPSKKAPSLDDDIVAAMTGSSLTSTLMSARRQFEDRFEEVFQLQQRQPQYSPQQRDFAMATFSNLVGGIGYFSGRGIIVEEDNTATSPQARKRYAFSPPHVLYSAVPSRPFFPRGFLWDEGFHQLLVLPWEESITRDVLGHWLNMMDENGWIAREQILGSEARSKVPQEFQPQNPIFANPPTLLFPIRHLITAVSDALKEKQESSSHEAQGLASVSSAELLQHQTSTMMTTTTIAKSDDDGSTFGARLAFLTNIYPYLERNYNWFLRTQSGAIPDTFRWRGRTENHTLTSGLDDYPRARKPSDQELHVDLLSWMAYYSAVIADLAELVNKDPQPFRQNYQRYLRSLEELHWNPNTGTYCDVISFQQVESDVETEAEPHYTVTHAEHVGYVNLFPFLLGLIPCDSPHLIRTLEALHDPQHLWSEFGLRSLSLSDELFGDGENYWKGPIWLNINYLALRVLHGRYAREEGPYRELARQIYEELRHNIVENMFKVYQQTGYVWEQYHPKTGMGQRSHPFTGWSALVVLLMSEVYP
ncbi:Processing alpha glucosidase I [Balamuthia mandrillaris]